ncbi:MAG TPA: NAD(P)H-dependent oxidoreductase subunit E [Solirubrobacterales bacterium]|nr:NAD(P)H-dependent oxidoreductase subunit E [Solirubrobacterales bacterium]
MSPLLPKRRRPWLDDPGHIHDVPGPPPMPVEQERVGVELPPEEIEVLEAATEEREPHGDPAPVPEPAEVEVPRALAQEIRRAMQRYPEKRSAAIPALWAIQRRYGYCSPEGITQAAAVIGVTPGYLQSIASFYDLFHLAPEGEHEVLVCTNISCWLRGADDVFAAFKEAAAPMRSTPSEGAPGGVGGEAEQPADVVAEEVPDLFVRHFECLGACDIAPMASIDERYFGPLTKDDAATAVEQLRSGADVLPDKRLEDRGAAGGKRAGGDPRISRHSLNKPPAKAKGSK